MADEQTKDKKTTTTTKTKTMKATNQVKVNLEVERKKKHNALRRRQLNEPVGNNLQSHSADLCIHV
ncbi:hypothetical protein RDWZM_000573 [Blomia tropicalis]|uniref:Uncharacterized protein n=1 Tax=Blomia tropicalis TaxID=40697 RepID=A0A9Q0MB62_BLOTA|nr:hypothetical protein RDWZM_000573 [Blomia tropicalis]